ncbi:hypothetical protein XENOCAPTIV_008448 [Xenoophorus captivus]|uniref:Uncharacterized protein n=1 Tax=Xenoophorus captivus TaxID=1517983 RepID=A0ABV0QRS9_9TELE
MFWFIYVQDQSPSSGVPPALSSGSDHCYLMLLQSQGWKLSHVFISIGPSSAGGSSAVVHSSYPSSCCLLHKHFCVSVVEPFLLHPSHNKLYGPEEARPSSFALITFCLPKNETSVQLLLQTSWRRSPRRAGDFSSGIQ